MPLYCGCDDWDDTPPERWCRIGKDFSVLDAKRARRCCSCGKLIKPGDEVVAVRRWRSPKDEVEFEIYGEDCWETGIGVPLANWYLCEECGGIALALEELGWCFWPADNMRELAREAAQYQLEQRRELS